MHFLILGGNGRTGQLVIEEGLSRGHTFTALVRKTASLSPQPGLTITQGSPLSKTDISSAINATATPPAAVLVTLNAPRASDSPFAKAISPPRLMADSIAAALSAMKSSSSSKAPVNKIVVMQAFGVGPSFKNLNFIMRTTIRQSNMSVQFKDHEMGKDEVLKANAENGVKYVLVRPAMLTDAEKNDVKVYLDDGASAGWWPSISRKSVAGFMNDAAAKDEWDGTAPVITN